MRRALPLLILALLAGCGAGGPPPLATGRIEASFPLGGVVDTIDVAAVERLPLRSAELVAPDGRTTAAISVAAGPAPSDTASAALPTGAFAGAATGIGAFGANPARPGAVGAAVQTQTTLLAAVSTATIRLPDPVAYRRDWRQYRIRLRFGDPPGTETREIPAPRPPA